MTEAIIAWCDTLTAALPLPPGTDLVGLNWVDETGQSRTADEVEPQARWAGRIVMARARRDRDTFNALIAALPDDDTVPRYLAVLITMIAGNLWAAKGIQHPKPRPDEDCDG